MQEHRHVKTTPGEPDAVPEFTPHPVRKEEGGNVQTDDINIPMVAVLVAFFAVILAVLIIGLQAGFYHYQAYERAVKHIAQETYTVRDDNGNIKVQGTELGDILHAQRDHLKMNGQVPTSAPATNAATNTATAPAPQYRMPIDVAMKQIEKEYAPK